MPAIAAIKVNAGSLSGIAKTTSATVASDGTFDPEGFRLPGVARWVNRVGGIPVGYPSFSLSVRPPQGVSRIFRITAKLDLPTLATTAPTTTTGIQPAPTKAYSCSAVLEVLLPERSTLNERAALLNTFVSFLQNQIDASDGSPSDQTGTPLTTAIVNLEAPY